MSGANETAIFSELDDESGLIARLAAELDQASAIMTMIVF